MLQRLVYLRLACQHRSATDQRWGPTIICQSPFRLLGCATAAGRKSDAHPDICTLTTTMICVTRVEPNATGIATSTRQTARQATERSLDPTHHRSPRCRLSSLAVTATPTLPVKNTALSTSSRHLAYTVMLDSGTSTSNGTTSTTSTPALPSAPLPTPPPPDLTGEY
ncbi:hypothetical protein EDD16DRAFT_1652200 [Pisolithus croceorrhizus]|nr:hypothetical protein EDD16DRAFT_1652200 [Pisolithus croceorrhizus]